MLITDKHPSLLILSIRGKLKFLYIRRQVSLLLTFLFVTHEFKISKGVCSYQPFPA